MVKNLVNLNFKVKICSQKYDDLTLMHLLCTILKKKVNNYDDDDDLFIRKW